MSGRSRPAPRPACRARSTSTISGSWPGAGCLAPSSTTSTAAPKPRGRSAPTCRAFEDVTLAPRCAVATPRRRSANHRRRRPSRPAVRPRAQSAAAVCSIRRRKRWPPARPGAPARPTSCPRCRGARSRTSRRRPRVRRGTSFTWSAAATSRSPASSARGRPASPRSSSRSTHRSPGFRERDLRNGIRTILSGRALADAALPSAVSREARDGSPRSSPTAA